ncbi:MAG: NAD synthetase [Sulfuricurvum sp. PC08-66]|nr:MAG: NAD synthetase [Sulfuricurvum sp. PC08-66]
MNQLAFLSDFLVRFIREEIYKTGLKKAVLGLSGGVDSAVVALLAKRALGDDLLCVMLPSQYSSPSSMEDAIALCEKHALRYEIVSIAPLLHAYNAKNLDNHRMGNFSARMRMATLYDISAREGALVLGTSNKSELMLGYGTLCGDLASALNPIGDIYKTKIFALAKELGVTDAIINKAPSADLYEGQSDEADLGYSYAQIDQALHYYVDERASKEEMLAMGIEEPLIDMLMKRIYANQFKRRMPLIAKVTHRTVNIDFNYARDVNL